MCLSQKYLRFYKVVDFKSIRYFKISRVHKVVDFSKVVDFKVLDILKFTRVHKVVPFSIFVTKKNPYVI